MRKGFIKIRHPFDRWVEVAVFDVREFIVDELQHLLHAHALASIADAHAPKHWPAEFVRYIDSFGQDKVMFGTDWPVFRMLGTMRGQLTSFAGHLTETPASEIPNIWSGNILRLLRHDRDQSWAAGEHTTAEAT